MNFYKTAITRNSQSYELKLADFIYSCNNIINLFIKSAINTNDRIVSIKLTIKNFDNNIPLHCFAKYISLKDIDKVINNRIAEEGKYLQLINCYCKKVMSNEDFSKYNKNDSNYLYDEILKKSIEVNVIEKYKSMFTEILEVLIYNQFDSKIITNSGKEVKTVSEITLERINKIAKEFSVLKYDKNLMDTNVEVSWEKGNNYIKVELQRYNKYSKE